MNGLLRISEAASIALHAMVLLASNTNHPLSNREIAERLCVSEAHLSKVLQRLKRAGFVKSIRGPQGGFMLLKNGDDITLEDVLISIDGPREYVNCLFETPVCEDIDCIMGNLLDMMNHQIRGYMAGKKISELTTVFNERSIHDKRNHIHR